MVSISVPLRANQFGGPAVGRGSLPPAYPLLMKSLFRRLALPPLGLLLAAAAVLLANEWAVARATHRIANIAYVPASAPDFDPKSQLLDIYQPTKASPTPRPVVLFIHGGSWDSGSKDDILYKAIGRRLAQQGFVGVVISYRLAPQVLGCPRRPTTAPAPWPGRWRTSVSTAATRRASCC
ncbi:MAG: alpha/beta hydrolase [Hymenobacter sp.]